MPVDTRALLIVINGMVPGKTTDIYHNTAGIIRVTGEVSHWLRWLEPGSVSAALKNCSGTTQVHTSVNS